MNKIHKLIELWHARPSRVEPDNNDHLSYLFTGLLPALRDAMPGIVAMIEQPATVTDSDSLATPRHESNGIRSTEPSVPKSVLVEPFSSGADGPAPAKSKHAGRKPEHLPEDLLNLLPPAGLKNADWLARANENDVSTRTFFRLRNVLEQGGKIRRSAITSQWQPILAE